MKRALAILAVCSLFGFGVWAQFSGEWSGEFQILPAGDYGLNSIDITLNYTFGDWETGATASYNYVWGFDDLTFEVSGPVGPISLEGSMTFVPSTKRVALVRNRVWDANLGEEGHTNLLVQYYPLAWYVNGPAYYSSDLSLSWDFGGLSFDFAVSHTRNYVYKVDWEDYAAFYATQAAKFDLVIGDDDWAIVLNKITLDPDGPNQAPDGDEVELPYKFDLVQTPSGTFPTATGTLEFTLGGEAFLDKVWNMLFSPTPFTGDWEDFIDTDDVEVWMLLPVYMEYTLSTTADPFSLEVVFDDVCTGIQFKEATLGFTGLGLCCGVTYDMEVTFTKAGFDTAVFTLNDLGFLCCGITMDLEVEFGTTYKEVSIDLDMVPESLCADVTFGIDLDTGEDWEILGFGIDYLEISCEFAECISFFSGTAFVSDDLEYLGLTWADGVDALPNGAKSQYDDEPADFPYIGVIFGTDVSETAADDWELASGTHYELTGTQDGEETTYPYDFDLWIWQEFEYTEFSFCGPGCCGGEYEVTLSAYWAKYWLVEGSIDQDKRITWGSATVDKPTILGLSRIGVDATIPVLTNLEITTGVDFDVFLGSFDVTLGWTFSF